MIPMPPKTYTRPSVLREQVTHYCPGCGHGIVHRLLAEIIEERGLRGKTVGLMPVGCAVIGYDYLDIDVCEAAHGRTPAVATGIKRALPDRLVFTYQGDGDLAAIGTAEIIHAANRGELFTTIFVNNAIYGMTGGQMAPTTLEGQVTTSSPTGRDVEMAGWPIRMAELLAGLPGVAYATRQAVLDVPGIRRTKKAIKLAFQAQLAGLGFSIVEIISTCNTNWHMGPVEALEWAKEHMVNYFPVGDTKVSDAVNALKGGK